MTYTANARPWPNRYRRSSHHTSTAIPRHQSVGHERQRDPDLPTGDPGTHPAAGDAAPDAQAAVPDLDPLPGTVSVAEVLLRRGDQAVDPGPEDTQRNSPDGHVQDEVRRGAPGAHPALGDDAGGHDPQHDAQGVGADRNRS